ncbi:MAG: hypothetical protein ICV81_19045, partial [Flavisolibacter sp.]|nr:hypothetical protein [Flavisolibacter sp.]
MSRLLLIALSFLLLISNLQAQQPFKHYTEAFDLRYHQKQPIINYTITVDEADLSAFAVQMHIRNSGDSFRVAMFTHPEYDEKYWRQIEQLQVESSKGKAQIKREDSALWSIKAPGGEAVIRYRMRLPSESNGQRAAWRLFLTPTGGLIGGPYTYLYIVGNTLAPSHVTVQLPQGWGAATALHRTSIPSIFFAPSVAVLMDGPILIGTFKKWSFTVDDVPHQVVYWP